MNQHKYNDEQIKSYVADKISEKAIREEFHVEYKRTLFLIQQHDIVGAHMKRAMEQGDFDNLEGAGKPLDLQFNPFEPVELQMVHKILKNAGYAPYWIELYKEINELRAKMDQEISSFKKYTRIVFSEKRSRLAIYRYEQKKKNFYILIREKLEGISKKILDYNLHCPMQLGRANFNIEHEMNNVVKDLEKLIEDRKELCSRT
ncbi:MAG: DnaJ family domain-containing protein [Acidobacteriota bacterium]